jgi:hypothetical protein
LAIGNASPGNLSATDLPPTITSPFHSKSRILEVPMRAKLSGLLPLFLFTFLSQTVFGTNNVDVLVRDALSTNPSVSAAAIAELRSMGPAGMQTLVQANLAEIKRHIEDPNQADSAEWLRLTVALDAVSQQKDSYLSQLYWYTDFEAAKKAASQSGKPILSLRLLGNLTDELSCANSRFFRSTLYANQYVATNLRDRFILHWQSVRAVPRITIDFGDGRKLERTITGNSIHYVLDTDGYPIDGMPGLHGPAAFLSRLADAEQAFRQVSGKEDVVRQRLLAQYHRSHITATSLEWFKDTAKIGGKIPEGMSLRQTDRGEALEIAPLAVTKMMTEATTLRAMTAAPESLGRVTDEAGWNKLAALHAENARLDAATYGLIEKQTRTIFESAKSSVNPDVMFQNVIQKLERSIALDTVRNEYLLHTKLHAWLAVIHGVENVDVLNERVYAELFMTPRSDPWFGLLSPDTYTGLDNGGVVRGIVSKN